MPVSLTDENYTHLVLWRPARGLHVSNEWTINSHDFQILNAITFQPDDKVGRGFVRVLEQLAVEMRRLLECSHGTLPESAHGARVLIKRLRALLWFASPAFSSSELKRSKSHLRKAAHL